MESLSDTPTESGHLAVALITGAYNITVSLLLAPVQYLGLFIWGLIRWSLSFWLGAFKLLTSPLTTALHIVLFIFSPVEYLVQFMLAPIFAISAIAIKLEPLYIFFSIAAILGTLTGLTIYLLTLPISSFLTNNNPPQPPKPPLPRFPPTYASDDEASFPTGKPTTDSRRSSLDFDTDDANALRSSILGSTRRPRGQQQQGGPDLYAAWREKVGSARGGGGSGSVSSSTVTAVLSPSGGGGNGGGSRKRLPGLLFGTTIHEEEDDSF